MPVSACFCTISATARRTRASSAAASWASPSSCALSAATRSAGRGRLPVWVVRIRLVLRFMTLSRLTCRVVTSHPRSATHPRKNAVDGQPPTRIFPLPKPRRASMVARNLQVREDDVTIFVRAALAAAALLAGAATPLHAQDYPTRVVTLVVPFPAGGGNDAMARLMAD